jgi:hypothetical protein
MRPEEINTAFLWPKASRVQVQSEGKGLFKEDSLLDKLESLVLQQKAWSSTVGTTIRSERSDKLTKWLNEQRNRKVRLDQRLGRGFDVSLELEDFPCNLDSPHSRVVTTSRRITYLIDEYEDFLSAVEAAFRSQALSRATQLLRPDLGVFVYLTNSVESRGRAFSGDPFTGQAAAFSRIFTRDLLGSQKLNFVAYYPHQLYSQFFTSAGTVPNNKGVRMLSSQANLLITCGGIMIDPKRWRIVT